MPDLSFSQSRTHILMVDDRPANLLALEAVLTELGETLVRAWSGEEALRLLADQDFAVILLDVQMPGWNGFETAQRVRALDRSRHTPIVFLSAAESDEFPVVEAYRLGAVDYLVKPIAPDILRAKVAAFVEVFRTGQRLRALEQRERERAETALRETEQRFTRFMAHLPGLAWIKDPDGRYLYVNDAAERAFGRPRADLYGRTDADLFPPETAALFRENDRRAARSPGGLQEVETLTHPDGSVHHSLVSKFPILGPDGTPAAVGGVAIDVTDRLRAETALQASEVRYRALVGATSHAVWSWSPAGGAGDLAHSQRWWEALTGQTPEEQAADRTAGWLAVVHPDDRERAAAAWGASLSTGLGYDVEYRVRKRGGGWGYIRARGLPIRAADGTVREWVGTMDDVTEPRRAEEVRRFLAEAGEVLASSLDYEETLAAVARLVVPRLADWCSVYVTAPDGRLRQVAVAHADPSKVSWAEELAGRYPPDPDAPRGVSAVVRSGQPELVPEVTDRMLVAAARDPEHLTILRGLGVKSAMTVPLTARGRTLGAITFVAAESELRYARGDLELAVDLGGRAGLAVDNARLFRESQELLRLLGLLVEGTGRLTGSLDPPAVRAAILDLSHRLVAADAYAIWQLTADRRAWAVAESAGLSEDFLRTEGQVSAVDRPMPDQPIVAEDALESDALGSRRRAYEAEGIASLLAVPLKSQGRVEGTLVFYYRTRRRFDAVVIRVAGALADLAGAALTTAELYARESESRRAAEEADRRKDEFIAVLAHELRNPLAPIRNSLQILRLRGGDPATADRVREMIERQAVHLGRLVDDLLDVSRIRTGKVRLQTEPLEVSDIARQSAHDHRPAYEAKGVTLATRTPERPAWVSGDRTRLAQVLDNLLTNALKFTPPGGQVELVVSDVRDGRVRLTVRDTGAGLEPDLLARLFEPFAQADRTLDRSGGGLGLGLAIVKGLVSLHGGTVTAQSDGLGRGARFTVTLPTCGAPLPAATIPLPGRRPGRRLRVLLVEDNRDAADSLCILLEAYGHEVAVEYTGPDGVRAAETSRPDVIVCDLGLPGISGYAVAEAVRRNPATAGTRLIALSGYGQEEDRRRAKEAGFDDHLTKPADPAALESLLVNASRGPTDSPSVGGEDSPRQRKGGKGSE